MGKDKLKLFLRLFCTDEFKIVFSRSLVPSVEVFDGKKCVGWWIFSTVPEVVLKWIVTLVETLVYETKVSVVSFLLRIIVANLCLLTQVQSDHQIPVS